MRGPERFTIYVEVGAFLLGRLLTTREIHNQHWVAGIGEGIFLHTFQRRLPLVGADATLLGIHHTNIGVVLPEGQKEGDLHVDEARKKRKTAVCQLYLLQILAHVSH